MPLDISKRLSLWAAAHPRSEASGLAIEAAEEIESLRKSLAESAKESSNYARLSGYYEGTLEVIASGYLDKESIQSVAKSSIHLAKETDRA